MRAKEVCKIYRVIWVKSKEHPFRIQYITIYQGVTIGSDDADPILFCPLGKKGCPPQFFRDLYAELTF